LICGFEALRGLARQLQFDVVFCELCVIYGCVFCYTFLRVFSICYVMLDSSRLCLFLSVAVYGIMILFFISDLVCFHFLFNVTFAFCIYYVMAVCTRENHR